MAIQYLCVCLQIMDSTKCLEIMKNNSFFSITLFSDQLMYVD